MRNSPDPTPKLRLVILSWLCFKCGEPAKCIVICSGIASNQCRYTRYLHRMNQSRSSVLHIGENSIVIVGGANQSKWELGPSAIQVRIGDFQGVCDISLPSLVTFITHQVIESAGAILLQREIPEEVNIQVARIANSHGVPVLLDAGGVEGPISPDLLSCLSILSPNETELSRLTGKPTDSMENVRRSSDGTPYPP